MYIYYRTKSDRKIACQRTRFGQGFGVRVTRAFHRTDFFLSPWSTARRRGQDHPVRVKPPHDPDPPAELMVGYPPGMTVAALKDAIAEQQSAIAAEQMGLRFTPDGGGGGGAATELADGAKSLEEFGVPNGGAIAVYDKG